MTICISIVSHGHGKYVADLLEDLSSTLPEGSQVVLTLNIPEKINFCENYSFRLQVLKNHIPAGLSKNNNNAFKLCDQKFFCVLNPDLRIFELNWENLCTKLESGGGVITPRICDMDGNLEDFARPFPTISQLILRYTFLRGVRQFSNYDWVGGMFHMYKSDVYRSIGGFDQRYFLYLEDVDICFKLKEYGAKIIIDDTQVVYHHSQRDSHRKVRYLIWHINSMLKFWMKFYRLVKTF